MQWMTVSELKHRVGNLELDDDICITQNGKPVYFISSVPTYETKSDQIRILSELFKDTGERISVEDFKAKMQEKYK